MGRDDASPRRLIRFRKLRRVEVILDIGDTTGSWVKFTAIYIVSDSSAGFSNDQVAIRLPFLRASQNLKEVGGFLQIESDRATNLFRLNMDIARRNPIRWRSDALLHVLYRDVRSVYTVFRCREQLSISTLPSP
jgi:hypothetical protein